VAVDQRIDLPGGGWERRMRIDLLENLEGILAELRRIFALFVREFS
jgi:hypothetical protein